MSPHCIAQRDANNITFYARRGDISNAPENSMPAIKAALALTPNRPGDAVGVLFDIAVTHDARPFVFHDDNMLRLTGRDLAAHDVTSQQLTSGLLEFGTQSNGMNYTEPHKIQLLEQLLPALCSWGRDHVGNGTVRVAAAVDMHLHTKSIQKIVDMLLSPEIAPCLVNKSTHELLIIAKDVHTAKVAKSRVDEHNSKTPVSLRVHPGTLPGGVYFWIKSELLHWWSGADGISAHISVYERFEPLMRHYNALGFCVGVYGGIEEQMEKFRKVADFAIIDRPRGISFADGEFDVDGAAQTYDKARLLYDVTLSLLAVLLIAWVFVGVTSMCFIYQRWAARKGYNRVDNESRILATKFVAGPPRESAAEKRPANKTMLVRAIPASCVPRPAVGPSLRVAWSVEDLVGPAWPSWADGARSPGSRAAGDVHALRMWCFAMVTGSAGGMVTCRSRAGYGGGVVRLVTGVAPVLSARPEARGAASGDVPS
eukprot:CAMPEP_0204337148 /NCGR_PEP_ID=MMETSP0469-20131031/20087_1 /ASSEMBLY_ACC=CAM_ASM_000384 /TAXON_ID=2969 /ORGANISM="Oxyrrhis marina" /LENGTH=482 /DNA_ID=CAMNT_0051321125 /DNA_START=105 /DNA_END=1551 /DNA_ORIENTATION=-